MVAGTPVVTVWELGLQLNPPGPGVGVGVGVGVIDPVGVGPGVPETRISTVSIELP